jgi:hypothetical protein
MLIFLADANISGLQKLTKLFICGARRAPGAFPRKNRPGFAGGIAAPERERQKIQNLKRGHTLMFTFEGPL